MEGYIVVDNGELDSFFRNADEAQERVDELYECNKEYVCNEFDIDYDSEEEVNAKIAEECGNVYYEDINIDEEDLDGEYTTFEGDTFSIEDILEMIEE